MPRQVVVEVEWDEEASVWIAACESIGLFTEAATLDELRRKIPLIASDLLVGDPTESIDLQVRLVVQFDQTVQAAA